MSHYDTTPSLPEDLNLHAGSSLKRTTSTDQLLYVPLAKRQQLDPFDFGAEFGWGDYSCGKDNYDLISGLRCLANTELEPRNKNMSVDALSHSPNFDDANIANTPAYITSIMDIVKPGDENINFSFSETPLAEQYHWPADAAGTNGNEGMKLLNADAAKMGAIVEDNVSLNAWNNNEEDDELLSELPTSIDDFQNKEYHMKLERHFSSPLVSSRQSPQCMSGRGSIASDAHPPYYSGSGKLSVASNSAFFDDEPLDEDDLEVAIINESFEEQQQQSVLYENFGLKSTFYGADMNQHISQADSDVFGNGADGVSSPAYATDSPTAADDEDTLTYRRTDRVSFVSPPTVFGENASEFTPLLTPKSKEFVRKSSSDMGHDDGSIVPSPHINAVYAPSDHDCHYEADVDYDKQLDDLDLEKMILGDDEGVQRFEAAIESGSRKSSLLKSRNYSGRLSDRSLPSVASLADVSSQLSDVADDPPNDVSPSVVMASTRSSVTDEKREASGQNGGAFLDVEERMLLSESVLRSLSEDDDYNEEVFEEPKSDECKKPECSPSATVVVEEKPAHTPEVHEQEVPSCVADSWEDLDDEELEKTAREAFQAKTSAKEMVVVLESAKSSPSTWDNSVLPFVLEAHGYAATTTLEEITETLSLCGFQDVWAKKIDDRHAFVVFPSAEKAANALFRKSQISIKLRPLSDSPSATQSQALKVKAILKPKTARPATNASVARRLIANSLGVSVQVSREKRQKEQEQLKLAKEQKKQKEAIWAD